MGHEPSSASTGALAAESRVTSPQMPVGTISGGYGTPALHMFRSAASASIRTKWFWYSIASCLCWTAWAFTARLASKEIPPGTIQFVSAFGFLLVVVALAEIKQIRVTIEGRGSWYALIAGLLLACGGIALYGAYRTGHDASVITATTSLYPVATVFFAVLLLRERPNKFQVLGIVFAVIAIVLLSR